MNQEHRIFPNTEILQSEKNNSELKNPKLFVIHEGRVQTFDLAGRQTFGRRTKESVPDISLNARTVSRRHGLFETSGEKICFTDTGSKNGTSLNDQPLSKDVPSILKDGSVLRVHAINSGGPEHDIVMVTALNYPSKLSWSRLGLGPEIRSLEVGRSQAISLRGRTVSRRHATFFHADNGWAIIDNKSLNGVFLNGHRIKEPVLLRPMDVIWIAEHIFVFLGDTILYQQDAADTRAYARENHENSISPQTVPQTTEKENKILELKADQKVCSEIEAGAAGQQPMKVLSGEKDSRRKDYLEKQNEKSLQTKPHAGKDSSGSNFMFADGLRLSGDRSSNNAPAATAAETHKRNYEKSASKSVSAGEKLLPAENLSESSAFTGSFALHKADVPVKSANNTGSHSSSNAVKVSNSSDSAKAVYTSNSAEAANILNAVHTEKKPITASQDGSVNASGKTAIIPGQKAPLRESRKRTRGERSLYIQIEERNVWNRLRKKTILRDINLQIEGGSLVLILGGSGAGKTTFMNAVMGYEPAKGRVVYGNNDIYREYEKMKYEIGYVPQQDLLRMEDVVYDTLDNAAQMRLPDSLTAQQREMRVLQTLEMFGLSRERNSLVGKLSGGQRKRLSIAVEYIGNPSLFFLDEPDSGLDGVMAKELMLSLRRIADQGKIVMVISHSPDRAFDLFDKVIVLAKSSADDSGRLIYFGGPAEACRFFETTTLEGIVGRINRKDEGGEGLADFFLRKANRK